MMLPLRANLCVYVFFFCDSSYGLEDSSLAIDQTNIDNIEQVAVRISRRDLNSHRRAERWTALSVTPFPNRTKTQGATLG